jgi:uncharacterized repeat protein (TIGR03803 family)
LYGTTNSGGTGGQGYNGTIFKITLSGALTTLYNFYSQPYGEDGSNPEAGLIQAIDGNFYGTTTQGGTYNAGTIFKLSPSGTLTTLHSLDYPEGQWPDAALIQASDGNLYGTALYGGANGVGSVFKVNHAGTLTVLHSFNGADGEWLYDALVQGTNGKIYGTTSAGGANGYGTVFTLCLGLRPFVETQPAYGKAGNAIKILGTNLVGATGVTFNGTPAVFNVVSSSLIKAIVPEGATTGTVQVALRNGTLSSNVPFRVKQ